MKNLLHEKIVERYDTLLEWYKDQVKECFLPFYTSFDIRDSGSKIAPVDANLYPAGFNNICQADKDSSYELVQTYIRQHYGTAVQNIGLLTEEHTNNPYYWDNVYWIKTLLSEAGFKVTLLLPKAVEEAITFTSASGYSLTVAPFNVETSSLVKNSEGENLDLIISNNDFSTAYDSWLKDIDVEVNPPLEMGWHNRRKIDFFNHYNQLATHFAELIDIPPVLLTIETQSYDKFSLSEEDSMQGLKAQAESIFENLKNQYEAHHIDQKPYLFIKNSAGTYGLGVIEIRSPEDILSWNYKARKKMKAAKGGGGIAAVILQEGIPTIVKDNNNTAEPAIYMIGDRLAGGFLRVNERKGPDENLNAPGAVFSRLCVSDLEFNHQGRMMENVYGWIARLSVLAVGREFQNKGIELCSKATR